MGCQNPWARFRGFFFLIRAPFSSGTTRDDDYIRKRPLIIAPVRCHALQNRGAINPRIQGLGPCLTCQNYGGCSSSLAERLPGSLATPVSDAGDPIGSGTTATL